MNVKTNVGRTFLKLTQKKILCNNNFYRILKKNTITICHSCMRKLMIVLHNTSILRPRAKEYVCSCRNKESCTLWNKCLTLKVLFEVTVTNNPDQKLVYFATAYITFKERHCTHSDNSSNSIISWSYKIFFVYISYEK